jgi:hypothetical protein
MTHGGYQPNMLLGCTFVYFGAVRADGSEWFGILEIYNLVIAALMVQSQPQIQSSANGMF